MVAVFRDRTTNLDQKSSRSILIRAREALAKKVFALNGRDCPDAHAASRSSRSLSNFQLVSRGARGRKVEATNALLRYDLARLAYCKAGRLSFQDVSDIFAVSMSAQVEASRDSCSDHQAELLPAAATSSRLDLDKPLTPPSVGKSRACNKEAGETRNAVTVEEIAPQHQVSEAGDHPRDLGAVALWQVIDNLQAQVCELRATCQSQSQRIIEQENETAAYRVDILRLQADVAELSRLLRAGQKLAPALEEPRLSELVRTVGPGSKLTHDARATENSRCADLPPVQSEVDQVSQPSCVDENVLSSSALETTVPTSNRWTALAQDSSGDAHGDGVPLESGPSPPAPSTISPVLQPDDDASQQSNGWSTICAPKRTRVLFVGGLLSTTTPEQLTSYINRTARKKVNIFTCFFD